MFTVEQIQNLLSSGKYEHTRHALHRIVERNISAFEIREAATNAELIEDYPSDKYGPSCLLLGWTKAKRPLQLHVSKSENITVKIITLYEPTLDEWENYRIREYCYEMYSMRHWCP